MESKGKMKVTVALACFAALSLFAAHYYRRRKQRAVKCSWELDNKPQKCFKHVLTDNTYTPFQHFKREEKPTIETYMDLHPYEDEIKVLMENSPSLNFLVNKALQKMDDSYTWVHTCSQLEMLADHLNKEHVFAVDTEQHSLRSFLGFTALMQISTQEEDYLLDTIALHDMMGILRPVFANPSICKVFHGADNDVLWLQRDFHIYVVNLFDTAKACEVLSKPHKSLAYLLETYCGTITNKILQREDWRRRPLSREMVQYARADAHYLLYIADCLSTELKGLNSDNLSTTSNKLNSFGEASRRSNMICLQLYVKDIEASSGDSAAASIFSRYLNGQGPFNCKSLEKKELVRQLCKWRDLMARMHDESLRYVLSDQAIVSLASMVPKSQQDIYHVIMHADWNLDSSNIFSSVPSPSYVVYSHVMDISHLLEEEMSNSDDALERVFQAHLRSTGTCRLSACSYSLSSKFSSKLTNRLYYKKNGGKISKQISRKASRELFVQKFSCKSPVYHNCRIYASDGRLLCYCDRRKLEWYLHRQLAKLVEDDPPGIMLLFEPKGHPLDEDNDFYIQSKKNICVGCGERNHYLRYRIIPSCYRVNFPEHLKSHRSHDIVLVCVDCHEIAHSAAEKYKKQIAEEFGIPLFVKRVIDSRKDQFITESSEPMVNLEEVGVSPLQLRTAAMALLRHGSRMPPKRREELTEVVREYFGGREVTEEDLETALLVGMSPHERRRLQKKRGWSSKHITENILERTSCDNNNRKNGISSLLDGGDTSEESNRKKSEDIDLSMAINFGVRGTDNVGQNLDSRRISEENGWVLDVENNNCEYMKQLDGTGSIISQIDSPKYAHKLSLLGHGPHGRKVVEYLLNEFGEEGICQFCQRWRQVFVEAIRPRFLPAGWDIMHSGRRDFGEYSVYNRQNEASNVVND